MGNDIKNKGIGGINKVSKTNEIKPTNEGSEVSEVDAVSGIQKVSQVSAVNGVTGVRSRHNTRIITLEEREALFKMINEEADDIFGKNSKRGNIAKEAVKMAIDAAIIKED